jgi:hypothetical protein
MSSVNLLRRALLIVAFAAAAATPAAAQVTAAPDAVPEFVPYVNDLQVFDQPDLSAYGRGPRAPVGYFGSMEYVNWAQVAPKLASIGQPGALLVNGSAVTTTNTGDVAIIPATSSFLLSSSVVTSSGVTVITNTFQSYAFSLISIGPNGPSTGTVGTILHGGLSQTSSMDTTFMSSADYTSGGRFEFGRMDEDGRGWIASGFGWGGATQDSTQSNVSVNFNNSPVGFIDLRGLNTLTPDGIDDDLDRDGIYGRYGADLGTNSVVGNPPFVLQGAEPTDGRPDFLSVATDFDDAVPLATKFVTLQVQNKTTSYGVELMRAWQVALGPRGGVWEIFLGPRALAVRDQFNFAGIAQTGTTDSEFYTNAQNWVIGGQLGGRWSRQVGRVQLSLEARALAAANYQHVTQSGEIGTIGFGATQVINVQLPARFSSTVNQTEFAPGGEFRANLKYQLFRSLYVQGGYTALFIDNIARGSYMTFYNLPNMGILADNNKTGFLLQGFNVGVVVNR